MPPKKSDEPKSISAVIDKVKSKYAQKMDTTRISTGVLPLDYIMGGGFISPTFTQIAGETQSGKSTLALTIARNLVKKGQNVIYMNFEQAPIQDLLAKMGMDTLPEEKFLPLAPATISEGEEVLKELVYCTEIGEDPYYHHIFFDSVGAMTPDWVEDREIDSSDNTPAVRARQLSKFFDINSAKLRRRNVCCWFVNHITEKIAMKPGDKSGKTTKGGSAIQYWTDTWIYLSRGTTLDQKTQENATGNKRFDDEKYANIGTIWLEKGRTGGMLKKTECPVFFGKGVSNVYWLYLVLKNNGYIRTNGAYLNCVLLDEKGVNCQGVPKLLKYLKDNQKEVIATMKSKGLWDFFDTNDNGVEA